MRSVHAVLCLGILIGSASSNAAERVTPSQLKKEIEQQGAKAIVLKYYDTPVWASSIDPGIRSASPEWLSVAEKLSPEADGAAGEDIDLALYGALAVAPLRVLPVLSRKYGGTVQELCNVSYDAELPKEGVKAYLDKIRQGLKHARTFEEKRLAAQCKKGLEQSLEAAKVRGLL